MLGDAAKSLIFYGSFYPFDQFNHLNAKFFQLFSQVQFTSPYGVPSILSLNDSTVPISFVHQVFSPHSPPHVLFSPYKLLINLQLPFLPINVPSPFICLQQCFKYRPVFRYTGQYIFFSKETRRYVDFLSHHVFDRIG